MADDPDWMVRENVARNENAPVEALLKLANDSDWRVTKLIVRNPNMTADALKTLANHSNFRLRFKARVALLNKMKEA